MFTGIIKEVGEAETAGRRGNLIRLEVFSPAVGAGSQTGDSIAVNGACLTVVAKKKDKLCFDVAASTLRDTSIGFFKKKEKVNLEPALRAGDKIGGHFVLGHIDSLQKIKRITNRKGYWEFEVYIEQKDKKYIAEKGSIALDGVSLTVKKILPRTFTLDIVPFTYNNTNLKFKKAGHQLNVEFDYLLKKKA